MCAGAVDRKKAGDFFFFFFGVFCFFGGQVVLCIFLFLFEILPNKIYKIKIK
jgi:hypothetical protein